VLNIAYFLLSVSTVNLMPVNSAVTPAANLPTSDNSFISFMF